MTSSSAAPALPLVDSRAAPLAARSLSAYEWQDTLWSTSIASYEPDLLRLRKMGVTNIFVDITRAVTYQQTHNPRLLTYLAAFRLLVADARTVGINIDALMADSEWATIGPDGITDALAVMSKLRQISSGRMPAGLQFDVEPWALPAWGSHKAAYALDYERMVQRVVTAWKAAKLKGSLGFTVPFWWNGIGGAVPDINPGTGPVDPLQATLRALEPVSGSYLNVMTYCTRPRSAGGTIAMFDSDLAAETAIRSSVTLLLGQEVAPDPAGTDATFYGASWHVWTTNLATLRSRFARVPEFGGIAVEDAQALLMLHES